MRFIAKKCKHIPKVRYEDNIDFSMLTGYILVHVDCRACGKNLIDSDDIRVTESQIDVLVGEDWITVAGVLDEIVESV